MRRNNRKWLIFLTLSCLASLARGSVSQVDTGTLRSLGLSRKEIKEARSSEPIENVEEEEVMIEEEVDDEEEPWKSNEDWWMDPLAMFSDDEEEEMLQEEIDESVPIITEAESLGDDIAVDEVDESVDDVEAEEIVDADEKSASLLDDDEISEEAEDSLMTPEESPEVASSPKTTALSKRVDTDSVSEPVVEAKPSKKAIPAKSKTTESQQVSQSDGGSNSAITSPLALLVPLIPKLQGALSNVPLTQLAASAIVVTFGINTVKNKRLGKREADNEKYSDEVDEEGELSEDLEDDSVDLSDNDEEEDEEEQEEASPESTKPQHRNENARRFVRPGWIREVRDKFARTPSGERIPSARELYAQVQTLEKSLEQAKTERDAMEQEYEKASFQVSSLRLIIMTGVQYHMLTKTSRL